MTLEESTDWALAALQKGDLEQLARALQARRDAIEEVLGSGQAPSGHIATRMAVALEAGDGLRAALAAWKRELTLESSHWRRMQEGFSGEPFPPNENQPAGLIRGTQKKPNPGGVRLKK